MSKAPEQAEPVAGPGLWVPGEQLIEARDALARAADTERAAIVAWLRAEADESRRGIDTASADMATLYVSRAVYYDQAAGMIERGLHHRAQALADLAEGDAELIGDSQAG